MCVCAGAWRVPLEKGIGSQSAGFASWHCQGGRNKPALSPWVGGRSRKSEV